MLVPADERPWLSVIGTFYENGTLNHYGTILLYNKFGLLNKYSLNSLTQTVQYFDN